MAEAIRVFLPEVLVRLFPAAPREVAVAAGSVAEAIAALDRRWPGMGDRLCDSSPAIRRHLKVFVEGERAGLDTTIRPGGEMLVMTAVSGG